MKKSLIKFLSLFVCVLALSCEGTGGGGGYISQKESTDAVALTATEVLDQVNPQDQQKLVNAVVGLLAQCGVPADLEEIASTVKDSMLDKLRDARVVELNVSDLYAIYSFDKDTRKWTITASDSELRLNYSVIPDTRNPYNVVPASISLKASGNSYLYPVKLAEDTALIIPKDIEIVVVYDSEKVLEGTMSISFPEGNQTVKLSLDLNGYVLDCSLDIDALSADAKLKLMIKNKEILTVNATVAGDFSGDFEFTKEAILPRIVSASANASILSKKMTAEIACSKVANLLAEWAALDAKEKSGAITTEAYVTGEAQLFNTYVTSNIAVNSNSFAKLQAYCAPDTIGNGVVDYGVGMGLYMLKDNVFVTFKEYCDVPALISVEQSAIATENEFIKLVFDFFKMR